MVYPYSAARPGRAATMVPPVAVLTQFSIAYRKKYGYKIPVEWFFLRQYVRHDGLAT
jgi:hypothetical protein